MHFYQNVYYYPCQNLRKPFRFQILISLTLYKTLKNLLTVFHCPYKTAAGFVVPSGRVCVPDVGPVLVPGRRNKSDVIGNYVLNPISHGIMAHIKKGERRNIARIEESEEGERERGKVKNTIEKGIL